MANWVFLRGLTRDSRHWGRFGETFVQAVPDARIVMLDLAGNGALHRQRSPLTIEAMASFCRTEVRRLGIDPPCHVLALSLGAMVAVAWAAGHPDEVSGCVLINTSLRPFGPFYQRLRPANYGALLRAALAVGSDRAVEQTILRLTSRGTDATGASTAAVIDAWTSYRRERPVSFRNALRQLIAAARYRAPLTPPAPRVLILASAGDRLVDARCSRRLARAWNASFAEHPTAGHDLPLDDGPWVAARVREWLDRPASDTRLS